MKVASINYSDIDGGAAIAAYRIHNALMSYGVDSYMYVNKAKTGDWSVQGPQGKWSRVLAKVRPPLGGLVTRLLKTDNPIIHSPAILRSAWPRKLNNSDADVIHLHWVNNEMLSIEDIGRIKKSVVWTLHDMWAFCGAEHISNDFRWRDGYLRNNRPDHEAGFDLNRWVWGRKLKYWDSPMHIVTPSKWLADCVQQSILMRDWPVSVIHNTINTEAWRPVEKPLARSLLGLPLMAPLLLFGTFGSNSAPHKGFDLLQSALQYLQGEVDDLQLVIFGQLAPRESVDLGYPVHYVGHMHDDLSLRVLYSAADVMVVPSRKEAFGQTAMEAQACGTPVVAFDTCGLPDIVQHKQTGYLAKIFDTVDLAQGIQWVISNNERYSNLCTNARDDAVSRFSYPVVAKQYMAVYEKAIRG